MAGRDGHRNPYVGEGADGARRSAEIDRAEADTCTTGGDRWQDLHESANRWERQAEEIEARQEQIAARRADDERHSAERDLIAQVTTAMISQTAAVTRQVIADWERRARRAEAELEIVRTEIRTQLGGTYMPMPHVLLNRLYPPEHAIEQEIEYRKGQES